MESGDADTTTVLGSTTTTRTLRPALFPSLLAVIVVVPGATPVTENVTCPDALLVAVAGWTVATLTELLVKVTVRPGSACPPEPRTVTLPLVEPGRTMESGEMARETVLAVATGCTTRTGWAPLLPSLVAEMVAVPAATAVTVNVTWPDAFVVAVAGDTVATLGALLVRFTLFPASEFDAASFTVTDPPVLPGSMTESGDTASATAFTTAVTDTLAVPFAAPTRASIAAFPGATAVTTPPADTVATALLDEDHAIPRFPFATPVTKAPDESRSAAESCCEPGTTRFDDAGVRVIDTIGTKSTVTAATPDTPSMVAVIDAVPGTRPSTSPVVAPTVATS